jgi:hypothetical protein
MPVNLRHPLTPKKQTENSIPSHGKRHNTFPNRHAQYRKNTESRLRSTTDHPQYVPSNSGQRLSMPLILLAPSDGDKPDWNEYYPSRRPSKHFSKTATLNTGKTQKVGFVRRPISHLKSHRLPVNGVRCPLNSGTQ